jgi:NADH:ubiquinone oxidoreductase subunit K
MGFIGLAFLGVIVMVHMLAILAMRALKKRIPVPMRFPCLEILLLGYILVALVFYASMPLAPTYPYVNSHAFVVVHVAACMPYVSLLIWLAIRRNKKTRGPEVGPFEDVSFAQECAHAIAHHQCIIRLQERVLVMSRTLSTSLSLKVEHVPTHLCTVLIGWSLLGLFLTTERGCKTHTPLQGVRWKSRQHQIRTEFGCLLRDVHLARPLNSIIRRRLKPAQVTLCSNRDPVKSFGMMCSSSCGKMSNR